MMLMMLMLMRVNYPPSDTNDDDGGDADGGDHVADKCEAGDDDDDDITPDRQSPQCRSYFELPEERAICEVYFAGNHILVKYIEESTYQWNGYFALCHDHTYCEKPSVLSTSLVCVSSKWFILFAKNIDS